MTVEARAAESPSSQRPVRRRPRLLRWVMEALLLVGAFLAVSRWQERHLIDAGSAAPSFDLSTLTGERVSLESLRGRRVLLHFWATWCGVCRREFGALNAVYRGLSKDEALISIVADAPEPEELRRFVAEHGIEYPVLVASEGLVRAFHVTAFPTNYYLDGDGRVRDHTVGMSTRYSLQARLGCAKP